MVLLPPPDAPVGGAALLCCLSHWGRGSGLDSVSTPPKHVEAIRPAQIAAGQGQAGISPDKAGAKRETNEELLSSISGSWSWLMQWRTGRNCFFNTCARRNAQKIVHFRQE